MPLIGRSLSNLSAEQGNGHSVQSWLSRRVKNISREGMREGLNISSLPSPAGRYKLSDKLGSGIFGKVYKASDSQAADKAVAVKVQKYTDENEIHIQEEYKILRDFTNHPNLIDFYGVFCENAEDYKIWFVLELCEFGSVIDIVRKLNMSDRKMSEEHIAYILKYAIKALVHLHNNKVMHRNIRCSNILITKDGEVKLSDFGLSCKLNGTLDKSKTNIGSPSWMAPEVVTCGEEGYGNRADVWALGITTIEIVDGKAPFQDMHPTRALFQIVRNPPPGLTKPAMWSNDINDFVAECLEKNPEHRPFMTELEEHPFIQSFQRSLAFPREEKLILTTHLKALNSLKHIEVLQNRIFFKFNRY